MMFLPREVSGVWKYKVLVLPRATFRSTSARYIISIALNNVTLLLTLFMKVLKSKAWRCPRSNEFAQDRHSHRFIIPERLTRGGRLNVTIKDWWIWIDVRSFEFACTARWDNVFLDTRGVALLSSKEAGH